MFLGRNLSFRVLFALLTVPIFTTANEASAQKACGQGQDFELILMLDFTGSTGTDEVTAEKAAVTALLDHFQTQTPKPRIALGRFNTSSTIEVPLTLDYTLIRTKLTQLPVRGSGGTAIKTGLEAARLHFQQMGNASKTKYIMLMSDGQTGGVEEVKILSKLIKDEGTFIFAIHYPVPNDPTKEIPGAELMRDFIASRPSTGFYFTVKDDLPGKVRDISINIGCEDGIACTTNLCNLTTKLCESHDLDADVDGVKDCADLCPNQDDKALGPNPTLKDDDGDGILTCVDACPTDFNKIEAGFCGCGKNDEDLNADGFIDCLNCQMVDFGATPAAFKATVKAQHKAVVQLAKRMMKAGDRKAVKAAKAAIKASKALLKESGKVAASLPPRVMACQSSRCATGSEYKAAVDRAEQISSTLFLQARTLYVSLLTITPGNKSAAKVYSKASLAASTGSRLTRSIPDGNPQCVKK